MYIKYLFLIYFFNMDKLNNLKEAFNVHINIKLYNLYIFLFI